MKVTEISLHTIWDAFRHQWKIFLLTVLVFALLGIGAGVLFAEKGAAPAAGSAQEIEPLSLADILYDDQYYQSCGDALYQQYDMSRQYLSFLSGQSVPEEWQETLEDLQEELSVFYKAYYQKIRVALNSWDTLYVPPEFMEEQTAKYEQLLRQARYDLISAEAAAEIVKSMDAPSIEGKGILQSYEELLSQAADYGSIKRDISRYEHILEQLSVDSAVMLENSREMDQWVDEAVDRINSIGAAISQAAEELAEDQNWNIEFTQSWDQYEFLVKHTHGESTRQESFAVLVLFCTLCGICVGGFLAVCREATLVSKAKRPAKDGE